MSNPWAQSFEELRSPHLQEKMAKKDYDGDGKIETGTQEYMGSRDKAIKKAMGKKVEDKKKVAEHHQKDANGNTIPHEDEGDGTPSSVEEMVDKKFGSSDKLNLDKAMKNIQSGNVKKIDKKVKKVTNEAKIDKIDPKNKRKRRNEVSFGKQTKPYDPPTKAYKTEMGKHLQKFRKKMHDQNRGTTYNRPKSKDSKYEEISYTAAYLPSYANVDEAKVDQGKDDASKINTRNQRAFGNRRDSKGGGHTGDDMEARRYNTEKGRGVKMRGKKDKTPINYKKRDSDKAIDEILGRKPKKEPTYLQKKARTVEIKRKIKNKEGKFAEEVELVNEADKKGKGSGTKDACYHKVKSRYSVWPSAYASGALVKCRKVGAKNWGNSSKKEEFDYYQMPMRSFGDMVGECWKTHRQEGYKMKGGKRVPNCVPKNESVEEAVGPFKNRDKASETPETRKNRDRTEKRLGQFAAKLKATKERTKKMKNENVEEAVKNPKLDIKETGVKNKIEINPEIKTEAAKAPVKK